MRAALITGVQGVGKTTVCRLAGQQLGLDTWDYADLMLRVRPQLASKDDIGDLTWSERNDVYQQVDGLLAMHFSPGDGRADVVLFENHLSVLDEHGTIQTFSHDAVAFYNPAALVVIECDPAEVLARRRADPLRNRHIGTCSEVADQQAINRAEAELIRQRFGLRTITIHNTVAADAAYALAGWLAGVTA